MALTERMKAKSWADAALLAGGALLAAGMTLHAQSRQTAVRPTVSEVPQFEVDSSWPKKLPNNWVLGLVSGVNVDAQDHVWVLHRPRTVKPEQKGRAAPAVLEFDAAGTFIQGWGDQATATSGPRRSTVFR